MYRRAYQYMWDKKHIGKVCIQIDQVRIPEKWQQKSRNLQLLFHAEILHSSRSSGFFDNDYAVANVALISSAKAIIGSQLHFCSEQKQKAQAEAVYTLRLRCSTCYGSSTIELTYNELGIRPIDNVGNSSTRTRDPAVPHGYMDRYRFGSVVTRKLSY